MNCNKWEITITGPYPCQIKLEYNGIDTIYNIDHKDIPDLIYLLQRTQSEIGFKLGKDAWEVGK